MLDCPHDKSPRFLALCVAPSHKLPRCSHSTHTTERGVLILTLPSLSQTTIKLISHAHTCAHTQACTHIIWYYSQIIQTLSRQEDKSLSNQPDIKRLGKHLSNSHFLPNFFPLTYNGKRNEKEYNYHKSRLFNYYYYMGLQAEENKGENKQLAHLSTCRRNFRTYISNPEIKTST